MPYPRVSFHRRLRLARQRSCFPARQPNSSVQPREFASSPLQIRRAIAPYRRWIESCLSVPLEEAMVLCTPMQVSQLALLKCDTDPCFAKHWPDELGRFADAVERVVHAPQAAKVLKLVDRSWKTSSKHLQAEYDMRQTHELVWEDGPVALRLRGKPPRDIGMT